MLAQNAVLVSVDESNFSSRSRLHKCWLPKKLTVEREHIQNQTLFLQPDERPGVQDDLQSSEQVSLQMVDDPEVVYAEPAGLEQSSPEQFKSIDDAEFDIQVPIQNKKIGVTPMMQQLENLRLSSGVATKHQSVAPENNGLRKQLNFDSISVTEKQEPELAISRLQEAS